MMIRVQGTVVGKGLNWVAVDVQGVAYQVYVSGLVLNEWMVGQAVTVWTHEVTREDRRELYGFLSPDALAFFWKLIEVNGVGPRLAQKILGSGSWESVRDAIVRGDVSVLTAIPGVGKKTGQKIVLELKGTLVDAQGEEGEDELVDVLRGLGYAVAEARSLASGVAKDLSMEERLREALRSGVGGSARTNA